MINTPFDDLAIKLSESGMAMRDKPTEKYIHCITFIQVCRIKYQQIHNISKLHWIRSEEMRKQSGGIRSLTTKEVIDGYAETLEVKVNYFSLLEELNRYGRVFEKKYGDILPNYFRIRFYRNRMIEHWDRYEEYLKIAGNGFTYKIGELITPMPIGAINTPAITDIAYKELSLEFQKFKITLPKLDVSMTADGKYSKEFFSNLARINGRLEEIPPSLVNSLFKYGFPIPTHNLDNYVSELVLWLEKIYTTL